jgi:hypothetical protein
VKQVTVVYNIVDEDAWEKVNPLKYAHNGLQAVRAAAGDALDAKDALAGLMPFVAEYTLSGKLAFERAQKVLKQGGAP